MKWSSTRLAGLAFAVFLVALLLVLPAVAVVQLLAHGSVGSARMLPDGVMVWFGFSWSLAVAFLVVFGVETYCFARADLTWANARKGLMLGYDTRERRRLLMRRVLSPRAWGVTGGTALATLLASFVLLAPWMVALLGDAPPLVPFAWLPREWGPTVVGTGFLLQFAAFLGFGATLWLVQAMLFGAGMPEPGEATEDRSTGRGLSRELLSLLLPVPVGYVAVAVLGVGWFVPGAVVGLVAPLVLLGDPGSLRKRARVLGWDLVYAVLSIGVIGLFAAPLARNMVLGSVDDRSVWVAVRELPAGHRLGPADLERRDLSSTLVSREGRSPALLDGTRLAMDVLAGQVVHAGRLDPIAGRRVARPVSTDLRGVWLDAGPAGVEPGDPVVLVREGCAWRHGVVGAIETRTAPVAALGDPVRTTLRAVRVDLPLATLDAALVEGLGEATLAREAPECP
ncbi:MAG: hypothetical protein H6737_31875 [Alphaproteobacteria bacterium]|nr:hypothetical protein [Alphaproteobacteria bacterium]